MNGCTGDAGSLLKLVERPALSHLPFAQHRDDEVAALTIQDPPVVRHGFEVTEAVDDPQDVRQPMSERLVTFQRRAVLRRFTNPDASR